MVTFTDSIDYSFAKRIFLLRDIEKKCDAYFISITKPLHSPNRGQNLLASDSRSQKSDAYKKMSVVSIVTIKGQTAVLEQTLKLKTGILIG